MRVGVDACCSVASAAGVDVDEGVEQRLEAVDALQMGVEDFTSGGLAGADGRSNFGDGGTGAGRHG